MDNKEQSWRVDWLGTNPVFYHTKTNKVSHNINDVIDYSDIEFDPQGLNNFLDAGFSLLGQTPLKHVKFIPANAEIRKTEAGGLEIIHHPDPMEKYFDYHLSEMDIFDLLTEKLDHWQQQVQGEIIVPLSGGCDSRLLTCLFPAKERLKAFTYGLAPNQSECFEVLTAKAVCKKIGVRWQQVELGDFHQYFDEWDRVNGISSHAHGMYHIEFYKKIAQLVDYSQAGLINGMGGGLSVDDRLVPEIETYRDLGKLFFSYGMNADASFSKLESCDDDWRKYFEEYQEQLGDYRFRNIICMRWRTIVFAHSLRTPKTFGLDTYTPMMDVDIAMAILNLPEERREDKCWMQDYFKKNHVDYLEIKEQYPYRNTLNYQAIKRMPPPLLDRVLLGEVIEEDYVDWINRNLKRFGKLEDRFWNFTRLPKINRVLKWGNIVDERKKAYFAYLTLKPIENLLKKRARVL